MSNKKSDKKDFTQWIKERKEVVDPKTGEVYKFGVFKQRLNLPKGYTIMFNEKMSELVEDDSLTLSQMRVLLVVYTSMEYDNVYRINNRRLAKRLKMTEATTSRAVKELKDRGIICMIERGIYRLNSEYGWRGTVKSLNEQRKKDHLTLVK